MLRAVSALIIGIAVIITANILAKAWRVTHDTRQTISVTGSASQDFTSDLIVWKAYFSRKAPSTQEAYAQLKSDADKIREYLQSKGISADEIVMSSIDIRQDYRYEWRNDQRHEFPDGYTLSQSVEVQSGEVNKVEKISREITQLIQEDIRINSYAPSYYYTKLAELKIKMLADATGDARTRAEQIATNANSDLGDLKNANMGVFQITGQYSNEDYTYGGAFNTQDKDKTASITVRLDFEID